MKIRTYLAAGGLFAVGAVGVAGAFAPSGSAGAPGPAVVPVAMAGEASAANYEIDGVHSGVVFRIMHAGAAPFHGMFSDISGTMAIDPRNPQATAIDVTIDTSSVMTGNNGRDEHLRSADFFNARQFPTSTFKATGAKSAGDGAMTVDGELTLLGKTLPVTATLTRTGEGSFRNQQRVGYEAKLSIKRSTFGMTHSIDSGMLGDQVDLTIFIEAIEQ
jgi:polyisoprenoid-binding protein YceI